MIGERGVGPLVEALNKNGGARTSSAASPGVGTLLACQLCQLRFATLPALQQHTLSTHSLADVLRLYCPQPPPGGIPVEAEAAALPLLVPAPPPQNFPTDLSCRRKRWPSSSNETNQPTSVNHLTSNQFKQIE